MYQYRVSFTVQNRNFTESVGANSAGDAIFLVKSRYHGAMIYGVTRI